MADEYDHELLHSESDPTRYQTDECLSTENVTVWQIIQLLFSRKKIEETGFSYVRDESLQERQVLNWTAGVSLLLQNFLLSIVDRWKSLGDKIEMTLNIFSSRKVSEAPKPGDDTYKSIIGHLDERVHLDKNIKPDNPRYNSALAAMAAKLAYENKGFIRKTVEEIWKMEFIDMGNFWNDTQGFMFHDRNVNMIVVAFRGTEFFNTIDWKTDVDFSCLSNKEMGKIHSGFMKALGLVMEDGQQNRGSWPRDKPCNGKNYAYYSIREKLKEKLEEDEETKFIVTGHSLGGALAILFPAILALHEEKSLLKRMKGVYTFGQPRVGDNQFKNFMERTFNEYGIKYLRFVYCNDIIPRVPPDFGPLDLKFKHFGTCLYFDSFYRGKVLDEVEHKNYFWLFGFTWIARWFNAYFELLRALFFLPLLAGRDYKESLSLIFFIRIPPLWFPFILPGFADHNPRDYVNLTRLGTFKRFAEVDDPPQTDALSYKKDN